jgi:branched-chain amino acid transport system ATP-binding protein
MTVEAPALDVRGLSIRFGRATIVESFDITCLPGSVTVLTGPNGAGKTSVLNAVNGMSRRHAGRIAIGGREVPYSWTPYKAFAYGIRRTFQVPRNWPSLDLVENIRLGSDRSEGAIAQQFDQLLSGVAVGRSPATLSLGQRRILELLRLLLARGECKLALLDEPLSGLDAVNAAKVSHAVEKLRRSDAAILIVDHEPHNWPESDVTVRLGVPQFLQDADGSN